MKTVIIIIAIIIVLVLILGVITVREYILFYSKVKKAEEVLTRNLTAEEALTRKLTCDDCIESNTCEFAGDPYNTDGDCLLMK